jgi:hypothetical protein
MVGDAGEHIGEPGAWVEVVEFGSLCRAPNYADAPYVQEVWLEL